MIGFRQMKKYLFDKSDLYFVAFLRPEKVIENIGTGDGEVAKCMWMSVVDYEQLEWKHQTQ